MLIGLKSFLFVVVVTLRRGRTMARFHCLGKTNLIRETLKMWVKVGSTTSIILFNIRMLMLSVSSVLNLIRLSAFLSRWNVMKVKFVSYWGGRGGKFRENLLFNIVVDCHYWYEVKWSFNASSDIESICGLCCPSPIARRFFHASWGLTPGPIKLYACLNLVLCIVCVVKFLSLL